MSYIASRVLGKRSWNVGYYETFEEAEKAINKLVNECGKMFHDMTVFKISTSYTIGVIKNGEFV